MPLKPSFVATSKKTCPFLVSEKASTSITGEGALPSVLPGAAQLNHWHYTPREPLGVLFPLPGCRTPSVLPRGGGGSGLPAVRNRKGSHPERGTAAAEGSCSATRVSLSFAFVFLPPLSASLTPSPAGGRTNRCGEFVALYEFAVPILVSRPFTAGRGQAAAPTHKPLAPS